MFLCLAFGVQAHERWYDLVIALATVGATLVSVIAVFVAAKSASAAKASADIAAKVLHRSAVRELVAKCHELIAEELRIQSLVIDLRSEYSAPSVLDASSGGEGENIRNDAFEKDLADVAEHTKEARSLIEDTSKLLSAADNDLDLMQGRIEASSAELPTIRESMLRQLESCRSQNKPYLNKNAT